MKIDGGCHCGRVGFKAEADPEKVYICHCTDCQVLTGSPFRITAMVQRDETELSGDPKSYVKFGDSGRKRLVFFCPECGTQVFTTGEGEAAAMLALRWGTIKQRRQLSPKHAIFCRSAAPWLSEVPKLPGKEAM